MAAAVGAVPARRAGSGAAAGRAGAAARARRAAARGAAAAARPQVGAHALVFAGGWSEAECRRAAEGTEAAGFDILEVPLLDPWGVDAEMTRRVCAEAGVTPTTSLGLKLGSDINSEDTDEVAAGEALLNAALDATGKMGAKVMCGVIYSALHKYGGVQTPAARANMVGALQRLARRADDLGITLGLEPVNRYETNACNTAKDCKALCEEVGGATCVVHLDSYHANIEESSMAQAVADAGDRLGYVHVGESHRGALGEGQADLAALLAALNDSGYSGPLVFESFSRKVVSADLSDALAVWRSPPGWTDSDTLAVNAREYIRRHAQR